MKIIFIVITLIVLACGLSLCFYEIRFNIGGYDILIGNRKDYNSVLGIHYKKGLELWIFSENMHKGIAEKRIWPK